MKYSALCVSSPNITPFLISVQDALLLDHSEGFRILRQHLAKSISLKFCDQHEHSSKEERKAWTVIRDILHALLAPIVALQEHAMTIAGEYLKSGRAEDLEYAFYGQARNAFVWLQSFLSSEQEWCLSHGCPACIVLQALDSEESVRLVVSSCLLSGIQSPTEMGRPTLPSLNFFIRSMRQAMDEDDLWGPAYFDGMEVKAYALQAAMQDLMYQCQTIELNLTPPASPDSAGLMESQLFLRTSKGMPVRRSEFAKKQAKMLREEAQWLRSVVKNCWDSHDADSFATPITTEFVRRLSTISVDG